MSERAPSLSLFSHSNGMGIPIRPYRAAVLFNGSLLSRPDDDVPRGHEPRRRCRRRAPPGVKGGRWTKPRWAWMSWHDAAVDGCIWYEGCGEGFESARSPPRVHLERTRAWGLVRGRRRQYSRRSVREPSVPGGHGRGATKTLRVGLGPVAKCVQDPRPASVGRGS